MRRRCLPSLSFLPILVLLLGPALGTLPAKAFESAVVQEILDGNELFIDGKTAKVKQKAAAPQKVSTQNSRGQIRFDSGAAGRLNRFALLKLGQGCFLIEQGQILVSGKQSGCTRSSRLSTRGTNYLVTLPDGGESELAVLEGALELQRLAGGNRVRLSSQGALLWQRPLFQGFSPAHPDPAQPSQGPVDRLCAAGALRPGRSHLHPLEPRGGRFPQGRPWPASTRTGRGGASPRSTTASVWPAAR